MNEPKNMESVAAYISSAEKRLSEQIKKQFAFMTFATLLPTLVLILVLVVIPLFYHEPQNQQLISALSEAHSQLADIAKILLNSTPADPRTVTRTLELVVKQAELHQQAIEEIRRSQNQITPETQSIIQVIGSAAILALLGALGLQRLQNIDTEINNVRESVFIQAESRAETIKQTLGSQVENEVQKQFSKREQDIQNLLNEGLTCLSFCVQLE